MSSVAQITKWQRGGLFNFKVSNSAHIVGLHEYNFPQRFGMSPAVSLMYELAQSRTPYLLEVTTDHTMMEEIRSFKIDLLESTRLQVAKVSLILRIS